MVKNGCQYVHHKHRVKCATCHRANTSHLHRVIHLFNPTTGVSLPKYVLGLLLSASAVSYGAIMSPYGGLAAAQMTTNHKIRLFSHKGYVSVCFPLLCHHHNIIQTTLGGSWPSCLECRAQKVVFARRCVTAILHLIFVVFWSFTAVKYVH